MKIILFLLMIIAAASKPLLSQPVIISDSAENYSLWDHVYIFVDKQGDFPLEKLINADWVKNDRKMIQFGISGNTYWFKFTVNNRLSKNLKFYLDTNDTQTEILELYQYDKNGMKLLQKAGRYHPESFRNWNRPEIIITPPSGETVYFLKAQSSSYITFDLILRTPIDFYKSIARSAIFYGAYFSILIVMILYNLLLFFGLRSRTYALYVLYLLAIFGQMFFGEGFGVLFLNEGYRSVYSVMVLNTALLFMSSFFDNRKKNPVLYKITYILIAVTTLYGAVSFFIQPHRIDFFITGSIVSPAAFIFVIVNCIIALRQGNPSAKYFIIGWFGLMFFSSLYLGVTSEILPANFLTLNGLAIGTVFETVILSLALAQQVNTSRKEKEEADRKSIDHKNRIIASISRFVPMQFVSFLGKESIIDIKLGDQVHKEMTILFSDIRSFTSLSEHQTPQETIDFLNSYFMSIGPLIRKNNGFIDKYIGDAIMALFPNKVDDAIMAAVNMIEQLHEYNKIRELTGQEQINIGIGIHTGNLMLGTIGESSRIEATVISDAVNTASRLEHLNKKLNTKILISKESLEKSDRRSEFNTRKIGRVAIRGKEDHLVVYEILT